MVTFCLKALRRMWERIMAEASASGSGLSWVRTSQRPPLLSRRMSSDSFWKHSRVASVIIGSVRYSMPVQEENHGTGPNVVADRRVRVRPERGSPCTGGGGPGGDPP